MFKYADDAYAAIRKTEGREWIDYKTISQLICESKRKARKQDEEIGGQWLKDNPVIAIRRIAIQY